MKISEYLDQSGIAYQVNEHHPTFTSQHLAAEEHEPGMYVAKPVIVKADDRYFMCVLSANHKINLGMLKEQLGAEKVELADEDEFSKLFSDCELGAEPPFGNLYDMETIMDSSLEGDDHITFQGGSHKTAITIEMEDYKRLVHPKVLNFSYHTTY